jgi:NADH-quinone oxidoreductase subunit N
MIFGRDALVALLPLIAVAATAIAVMLVAAFRRGHALPALSLTLVGLAVACAALPAAAQISPVALPLLLVDRYALFFMGLVFAATFAIAILCYRYFGGDESRHESLYILLLLAALGAAVLAAANHFASFFLGLELLSVSLFALIAWWRSADHGIEAGIKYLVLAGFSSSFLLFGMALVYAGTGSMEFTQVAALTTGTGQRADAYALVGLVLILVGLGFKLALVPFHMWTPDVYEGAPAPVAAFVATVSKGAAVAVLLRYCTAVGAEAAPAANAALAAIAIASILAGNLLALLQSNVKRILAYSSIAHLGYLVVALLAVRTIGAEAIAYYLVAYFVTMIGAFAVVALVSDGRLGHDTDALDDYTGMFRERPWLAGAFTAMLLSLAGIPLTMGFVGKFYILAAGVDASLWLLVVVLVVGSVVGLFYYLRIVAAMCAQPHPATGRAAAAPSVASGIVLACLTLLLIVLGVYPAPLIRIIQAALAGFA